MSDKTKITVFKAVIAPIALYGVESLPLLDKHLSKFQAIEMKYKRRIIGKTRRDRLRNERVREEAGQEKAITTTIEERQLMWFGHVQRMNDCRKEKAATEMAVEGKNPRGRPRATFLDRIVKIGQKRGKTVPQLKKECQDRGKWKKWVQGSPNA